MLTLRRPKKDVAKRSFQFLAGRLWNRLPNEIRLMDSIEGFKLKLGHIDLSRLMLDPD